VLADRRAVDRGEIEPRGLWLPRQRRMSTTSPTKVTLLLSDPGVNQLCRDKSAVRTDSDWNTIFDGLGP